MSPTVNPRPMKRLYVTRVKSKTSNPGKINADKYLITSSNGYTSFIVFCLLILKIYLIKSNINDYFLRNQGTRYALFQFKKFLFKNGERHWAAKVKALDHRVKMESNVIQLFLGFNPFNDNF